ncbi:hypothetical protein GCM10009678_57550 [Actinomadura kijaniata]|uniref:FHA domain-containing protein n=1 Tax=Actinomadura namibiensis TaxID=182080 RepID=A0A7W3QKA0_ACTNM|nr:FHA domain-containing protein [Actinomadura namibiensis]MBA8950187.1 hypothetical protein [Actinomadura namibiensis]
MPRCPNGHASADDQFCEVCGELVEGARRADLSAPSGAGETVGDAPGEPAGRRERPPRVLPPRPPAESCPMCETPRSGRFCEVDGYDFELRTIPPPAPPEPIRWIAVVTVDRAQFERVLAQEGPDAPALRFPEARVRREIPLHGGKVLIGRRSLSRGIDPDIDLGEPPADPGVSHTHAVLGARADGTWDLVDPGSTNGTTVNDATQPIEVGTPVRVGDGDRIHVGAWTTITLTAVLPSEEGHR